MAKIKVLKVDKKRKPKLKIGRKRRIDKKVKFYKKTKW